MIKVGITGGIGSGKSTVIKLLTEVEPGTVASLLMDDVSKELMNNDPDLRARLQAEFGTDVYEDGGSGPLNRAKLASIVFTDASQLAKINAIVHPPTFETTLRRVAEFEARGYKVVLIETALLFTTRAHALNDVNVLVVAPLHVRLERAMARTGLSRDQVVQRMANQIDWTTVEDRADHVVANDSDDLDALRIAVRALFDMLIARAKKL